MLSFLPLEMVQIGHSCKVVFRIVSYLIVMSMVKGSTVKKVNQSVIHVKGDASKADTRRGKLFYYFCPTQYV